MKRSVYLFVASLFFFGLTTPAVADTLPTIDAICTPDLNGPILNQITLGFSPGLKLLQRETTLTGSGSVSCLYLADGAMHTATIPTITGSGNLSCLVNTDAEGTVVFNWNDGLPEPTSVFTYKSIEVAGIGLPTLPRVFILSGTVTSGRFLNDNLVISYNDIPNLNYLDCLFSGLTQISGPATTVFTRPAQL